MAGAGKRPSEVVRVTDHLSFSAEASSSSAARSKAGASVLTNITASPIVLMKCTGGTATSRARPDSQTVEQARSVDIDVVGHRLNV